MLALIVERVTGRAFHDVLAERVCAPAGLEHTAYLRSDELPASVARGYLDDSGLRTNVLLPSRSLTWTVVSNTSNGIRPLVRFLAERLDA